MSERVLISGKLDQACVQRLQSDRRLEVTYIPDCSREELIKNIRDASILITRSETKIDLELLKSAPKLRVIGRAAVGTSNIDIDQATNRGILVFNTPGKNTNSAAELTFALLMSMLRKTPKAYIEVKKGSWNRHLFTGRELRGMTIGIVGLGNVGHRIAKFSHGFDMKVMAYDPYIASEKFEKYRVQRCKSLAELARKSDILSLHVPLNKETRNLIQDEIIRMMAPGSYIINTSRGGVVAEPDLLKALKDNHLAGVAIDTWETEPLPEPELRDHPNTWCTPHIGASTIEAQKLVGESVFTQIQKALDGVVVDYPVNLPSNLEQTNKGLKSYTLLAEKIGSLLSQVLDFNPREISVGFYGELTNTDNTMIKLGFMKGYVANIKDDYISMVNAQRHFSDLGLVLKENKEPDFENIQSCITVAAIGETNRRFTLSGLLFNYDTIRISNINGFNFELEPKGNLLMIENYDFPGSLAKLEPF